MPMKLSRSSGYALAALVHLARQESGVILTSRKIATATGLSEQYLLKPLKPLAAAGVLRSLKGPHGGYTLARPAEDITVLEVVEATDGPLRGEASRFDGTGTEDLDQCLDQVCKDVALRLRDSLRGITLAELAGGQKPRRQKGKGA
jgi:Rrf2 family protein